MAIQLPTPASAMLATHTVAARPARAVPPAAGSDDRGGKWQRVRSVLDGEEACDDEVEGANSKCDGKFNFWC